MNFDWWLRASRERHRRVFSGIFRRNAWGSEESVSGPGSTRERGSVVAPAIVKLLTNLGVKTLLDAPCGDFNWAATVADAVESYIGVDVVEELITRNQREHAALNRRFFIADITRDSLPKADVILSRDSLVHFSYADIRAALRNFRESGSEYLLTPTFIDRKANRNIRTGGWRALNLQIPPFNLPAPIEIIDEQCLHTGGIYRDKRLALWRLSDL
ncbi:MAG: class I SAM-dependent methyltransferase [Thermoanaerobaculia bacterium]